MLLSEAQPNWRRWGDNDLQSAPSTSSLSSRLISAGGGGGGGAFMISSKVHAVLERLTWVLKGGHDTDLEGTDFEVDPIGMMTKKKEKDVEERRVGAREKVVVFSQWTSMLDILEKSLSLDSTTVANNNEPVIFRRLDGSMSQQDRSKAIAQFNEDPKIQVLLLSLKAGGVGLNLTTASTCLMIDPWWNPTTEDQAIDRVHRLGQTRHVHVYRFVCSGTVEERLLALQDRKRGMAADALGGGADRQVGPSSVWMSCAPSCSEEQNM